MDNNNPSKRMHPLVAGAAVSVMLVSLTGVAAMTGLIPSSHGTLTPTTQTLPASATSNASAATTLVDAKTDTDKPYAHEKAALPERQARSEEANRANDAPTSEQAPQAIAQAPVICRSCGRVESVRTIQHAAQPSGLGIAAGAVLGGVLGNQVGGGNGRTLATVAGAVGGGYAGNEVEKRSRTTTSYQVRVRMEDGSIRTFPYAQQPGWNTGDRVRVVNGHLTSRA